jgi:hypothetical protein
MSKPTNKPGWNPSDPSKVVEPTSTKKAQGWAAGEKPAAEHFNWLMKTVSQWIDYVDVEGVQGPKGDTGPKGDAGPAGPAGAAGSISAADLARIAALEAAVGAAGSSPVTVTFPYNGGAAPGEFDAGAVLPNSSKTINWTNGASQLLLLDADCNVSFTNAVSGNTYYLRIQQGGYGKKQAYLPSNIIWDSGSVPVISTNPWTIDVIGLYFDGTYYYGYVSQGYSSSLAIDTKNGYIAGGNFGNGTTTVVVGNVDKINFNSDQTISTIQTTFGQTLNSTGSPIYPNVLSACGQGTQSSEHGYQITSIYSSLPAISGRSSTDAAHKLAFANDTGAVTTIRVATNLTAINVAHNNRAVVQSDSNAYFLTSVLSAGTSYQTAKLQFSNDVSSNVVATGPNVSGARQLITTHGISTSISGIFWGLGGFTSASTSGAKMLFSTDTTLTTSTYVLPAAATAESYSEAVDGVYKGYYIRGTGTAGSPTTTAYVTDKSVEGWSTLSTILSQPGSGSAATQGLNAGYFCGAVNRAGATGATTIPNTAVSLSQIKKIEFNTDNFTVHSASLNQARVVACGFEG